MRGTLILGGVGAAAWLGVYHSPLWAALVGLASLAVFGRDLGGSGEERKPFEAVPELSAAFETLCSELELSGVLYASYDDERLLRPVASAGTAPGGPLRAGDDAIAMAMHALKPQVFTAYTAPEAVGLRRFEGRSTLVHPLVRLGRPVGLAVLTSQRFEIAATHMERVRSAEPMLALLLDNEVLAGRLARSHSEKEALVALTRLAQGRSDSDQVFQEAALHLRRLTGASHVAIALRSPGDRLVIGGLSAEGGGKVRETLMTADLAEREWPHLHRALNDPMGSTLLSLASAPLTPTEAAWARQIAPNGHLLGVAFGPEAEREGLVILCWPEESALRIDESRLAQRLGDLMALVAAARRQGLMVRAAEAREASSVQLAATQEALIGQLALEVRKATYAVQHWRAEVEAGSLPSTEVLHAMEQQTAAFSAWLAAAGQEGAAETSSSLRAGVQEALTVAREACRRKGQPLLAEEPPEAELPLSRAAVVSILGALLDNASRYSEPGSPIRLWSAVSEVWATVYVTDRGAGIPEALQGRVSEPGFQADPVRGGQGMALAQARELVDRAGGVLGFTSKEGEGSTFYVTLPIGPAEARH